MAWIKTGRVFTVDGGVAWATTHAAVPVPQLLEGDRRLRVFFGARDADNRSRIGALEMRPEDGSLLGVGTAPALDLGPRGAFDDSGIMPACVVTAGDECRLYYLAVRPAERVPYEMAIGVATSHDGGRTFQRCETGPVFAADSKESLVTSPCVVRDGDGWRMWYVSGTGWVEVSGRLDPVYDVKHATSADGLEWSRDGVTRIAPDGPGEAIGRPWVVGGPGAWEMWYSRRATADFRSDRNASYRIGYARSPDGLRWDRRDDEAGIDVSPTGWDSEMIEYPAVYALRGERHLLYNGNRFGATGFGHAVWR